MRTTKIWLLPAPYTDEDVEWINNSNISYHIEHPDKWDENDSGWCDYNTGATVLTNLHKIYIKTENDKEEMWLKLRYTGRVSLFQMYHYDGDTFVD